MAEEKLLSNMAGRKGGTGSTLFGLSQKQPLTPFLNQYSVNVKEAVQKLVDVVKQV